METEVMKPGNQIEDVLALLPELFPGVQEIHLGNIRPNPKNPGPPLIPEEIQNLAQNIAAAGLLNHIKVQPDRVNPLAAGVQLHPSNPRLRGDGQPWALGDFNFKILAGENRYRAFVHLKREAIPGLILNPTAKEAVKITHLDNAVRDRGWWAAYQTIEQYIQADPNLTQRQVAVELKLDLKKVNRAMGFLPLLNPEARTLIVGVANNSNKRIWGISELAASRLADLGPGTGLKPGVRKKNPVGEADSPTEPTHPNHGPRLETSAQGEAQKLWPYPAIPSETQDLVLRALRVACDQGMTEAQVKRLVGWVKNGKSPESYSDSGKGVKVGKAEGEGHNPANQADPSPETATLVGEEALPGTDSTGSTSSPQAHSVRSAQAGVVHSQGPQVEAPSEPSLLWKELAGITLVSQIKAKLKKGEPLAFGEKLVLDAHGIAQAALWAWKHLLKPLLKVLQRSALWIARHLWKWAKATVKGIAHWLGGTANGLFQAIAPILLLVLLGWVGWNWGVNHVSPLSYPQRVWNWSRGKVESVFKSNQPKPTVSQPKPATVPTVPQALPEKPASQVVKQKPVPHRAPVNKKAKVLSAPQAVVAGEPAVPEELKTRVEMDSHRAIQFAGYFYGTTFRAMKEWQDYFHDALAENYTSYFFNEFYPPVRLQEISQKKLTQFFHMTESPKLLRVDDLSDDFLVEGTVTNQRDSLSNDPVSAPKQVALIVGVWRDGKVFKVEPRKQNY